MKRRLNLLIILLSWCLPIISSAGCGTMQHCFSEFLSQPLYQFTYEPLAGGFSRNSSYIYCVNDKKYVVRMLGEPLHFRKAEIEAHLLAASMNIAPTIHYYDKSDYAFMIMDFIDGTTLSLQQAQNHDVLQSVAHKMRLMTQTDISTLEFIPQRDVFAFILENYEMIMKRSEYAFLFSLVEDMICKVGMLVDSIEKNNRGFVLSHNDLHPRNIFFTGDDVLFIDWEMVGIAYELFDIANYSFYANLSDDQDFFLLSQYLEHELSIDELDHFKAMKLLATAYNATAILAWVAQVPSDFSLDTVGKCEDYLALFADDIEANSHDFLLLSGVSALKEFFVKYNVL